MMQLYFYRGRWNVASSRAPDAGGPVPHHRDLAAKLGLHTLADLFWYCYEQCDYKEPPAEVRHICFVMELMTEFNTVVVRPKYQEQSLVCLSMRNMTTLEEIPVDKHALRLIGCSFFSTPTRFDVDNPHVDSKVSSSPMIEKAGVYRSLEAVVDAARQLNPMKQEGFVVCDHHWRRLKIKSPQYVGLHQMMNNQGKDIKDIPTDEDNRRFRERKVVSAVLANDQAEFLSYYPILVPLVAKARFRLQWLCTAIARGIRASSTDETSCEAHNEGALEICLLPTWLQNPIRIAIKGSDTTLAAEDVATMVHEILAAQPLKEVIALPSITRSRVRIEESW